MAKPGSQPAKGPVTWFVTCLLKRATRRERGIRGAGYGANPRWLARKESVVANDSKVVINLATGLEDGATVFSY
jgi:hypothetical protein